MTTLADIPAAVMERHRRAHAANMAAAKTTVQPSSTIVYAQPSTAAPRGAGTELRKLLHTIGIQPRGPKCKCNEHAQEMDTRGPEWCEEHMDEIIEWLEIEAKKRPLLGLLFSRLAARQVVKLAIRRALSLTPAA